MEWWQVLLLVIGIADGIRKAMNITLTEDTSNGTEDNHS